MGKKKRKKITSPVGIAKYPWLNKPDTQFDPQGVFKTSILLDPEEHREFLDRLDKMADTAYNKAKQKLEKNKPQKVDQLRRKDPYDKVYDDEGEPTGKVEVKFKMKHKIETEQGTMTLTPDIFDGKGKVIDRDQVNIYGGSRLRVNFTPSPYYMAVNDLAGVSLQMNAVQVIELAERGSNADYYGFGEVDDGFDSEQHEADSQDFDDGEDQDDEFDFSEEDF